MNNPISWLAPALILSCALFPGCEDNGVTPTALLYVVSFNSSPKSVLEGDTVVFRLRAAAERGLARGIIDYRDGTKRDTVKLTGVRDSAFTHHAYQAPGIYKSLLTLEDAAGEKAGAYDSLFVGANQLPQITNLLTGTEGSVSRYPRKALAFDPEGDSLTISVAPVSAGLVFQLNAKKDSAINFLTNPGDNGTKQGKVTVVDQKNRTVEKVIDLVFTPLDDISGRVHDRFEGTYLATYRSTAVMQGPFTGWVSAITGGNTVTVPVDANGNYVLPKLPSAKHILRAFITNGRDSSFIANNQVSPGDQTCDVGVETNAGTGMPLDRLLMMYQLVNFRTIHGMGSPGFLTGIDIKYNAVHYVYYLLGRDTMLTWLNAKHLTAEQQNWLEGQIQTRCFAHIPPANRPRIIKGGPGDPVPLRGGSGFVGNPPFVPSDGHVIVYASLFQQVTEGQITLWDQFYDGLYDCGRVALNTGDAAAPPYGMSIYALVQEIGASISGSGVLKDPYYNNKSTRAEHTTLDAPSTADMKLDWQVILELPGEYNHSNVEEKYFEMPD